MMEKENVSDKIKRISTNIYSDIVREKKPEISMPLRSLSNVSYDDVQGYFKLMGKFKQRTLTASTVKTFAQTLKMMGLSKELVESDDIATLLRCQASKYVLPLLTLDKKSLIKLLSTGLS